MKNCKFIWLLGFVVPLSQVQASIVDPPFATDSFASDAALTLTLLPAWTGLPDPIDVALNFQGPTTVNRETIPFVQSGRDTIDTEIVSMSLTGSGFGFPISIRAGAGNGFFPLLPLSGGQIQDLAGSPQDGIIDFPADSIFDVFFDVWVDLDLDSIADVGEVVRNFDGAVRMRNGMLDAVPPSVGQIYDGVNVVEQNNPDIGSFLAAPLLPLPVDLFVVLPDGSKGPLHATASVERHRVIPEPSALVVWLLLGMTLGGACWWRRRTHQ